MYKTEFYSTAVKSGFYGIEKSGLFGKLDNVRKYWENISTKFLIRDSIQSLLEKKSGLRLVDLGAGSGEGFDLLTHLPPANHVKSVQKDFVLKPSDIAEYVGLDISREMVSQGRLNFAERDNVRFIQADLSEGFPLMREDPFDVYFSSYASLSHITYEELQQLFEQICRHAGDRSLMVFDMLGRYSPEWPCYWGTRRGEMHPYTMAYLLPETQWLTRAEKFYNAYWTPADLELLVKNAAKKTRRRVRVLAMRDRSILVGRHMDTGIFNGQRQQWRYQVNRLFDRDYRGELRNLRIDLSFIEPGRFENRLFWRRIVEYSEKWNIVIECLESLMSSGEYDLNCFDSIRHPELSEELEMLIWLHQNAGRFPVADFWASIMGAQVACVLRNVEMNLKPAVGAGHGLLAVVEIS